MGEGFLQSKSGLYCDLFEARKQRLFEAKYLRTTDVKGRRRRIREAFGQLYDYRRSFKEPVSLGVLVNLEPPEDVKSFLKRYRVTTIWRCPDGSFESTTRGWS
jgi:hypothetical protein